MGFTPPGNAEASHDAAQAVRADPAHAEGEEDFSGTSLFLGELERMEGNLPERERRSGDLLRTIAADLYAYLGKTFPVCCESDEFFYFPQVVPPPGAWPGWDDFSPERIGEVKERLSSVEREIDRLPEPPGDREFPVDAETLKRLAKTLREQLDEVRFHETQPTFHLTVLCMGLASSLGDADRGAWGIRARTAPAFLARAREALTDMPGSFRDLGLSMVRDTKGWLHSLGMEEAETAPVASALERFEDFLHDAGTGREHRLDPEVVSRVVRDHIGCGVGPDEVRSALREEMDEMFGVMEGVCRKSFSGKSWREAVRSIPLPDLPGGDPLPVYRKEAEDLLGHCIDLGIVPDDLPSWSPLRVSLLPPYLRAIRAASAYTFSPGPRSQSGTFFIVPLTGSWDNHLEDLVDYRMLTAHEAYPGHHLLDSWRWRFVSPVRRPVETPLFYEGWACFAEQLMRFSGYFSAPADLLLLAKRRYRRAVRGLVDLDLQTGKRDPASAAGLLADAGFSRDAASSVVPKYALRPGYQVCYAFGIRRFLDLYSRYGAGDGKRFAHAVLSCGEIGFDRLEKILKARFA